MDTFNANEVIRLLEAIKFALQCINVGVWLSVGLALGRLVSR